MRGACDSRCYPCFSTPLASHPSPLCSLSAVWFGCSFPHLSPINCSRKSPQLQLEPLTINYYQRAGQIINTQLWLQLPLLLLQTFSAVLAAVFFLYDCNSGGSMSTTFVVESRFWSISLLKNADPKGQYTNSFSIKLPYSTTFLDKYEMQELLACCKICSYFQVGTVCTADIVGNFNYSPDIATNLLLKLIHPSNLYLPLLPLWAPQPNTANHDSNKSYLQNINGWFHLHFQHRKTLPKKNNSIDMTSMVSNQGQGDRLLQTSLL